MGETEGKGVRPEPILQPRAPPLELDIEALGRQRPDIFPSIGAELGFCFSLLTSMLMTVSPLTKCLIHSTATSELTRCRNTS
jgi:hypothetical protein